MRLPTNRFAPFVSIAQGAVCPPTSFSTASLS
jgi:hypothetical protein